MNKRLATAFTVGRLTLALALSSTATGCVVLTFDDTASIRRVPTSEVIENPEILLGIADETKTSPRRR